MLTHCGVTKITTRFHKEVAKVLLNLPPRSSSTEAVHRLDAIVVFILIKLAKAMIYTLIVCVPIWASKLSFSSTKGCNSLDNDLKNSKSLSVFKAQLKTL